MFRLVTSVSLIITSQIYFVFGFHNVTVFNNRNCFNVRVRNKHDVSFAKGNSPPWLIGCSKADILNATLQHKENPLNITSSHIRPVLDGTSELHPAILLDNSSLFNGLNASDIQMILAMKSHSEKMTKWKKQCTAKKIQIMSANLNCTKEYVYSMHPRFKSLLNIIFLVLIALVLGSYYSISHKKFGLKVLVCLVLFSLFGIALSFEIFLLSLAVLFGVYISYKALTRHFSPFINRLFGTIQGFMHGGILCGKIKILSFCLFVGLVNFTIFQITSKFSVEVFLFAYINNIVVLSAYSLLLNKRSNLEKSSGNNNEESSLTFRNYNTIESLQIQKDLKTFDEGLRKRNESTSIVGISCRFAKGVNSKDAFWDLLVGSGCVISSYPENRLEALALKRFYNPARQVPGKHYTLKGAFLDEIAGFDAQFFGISPAECRAMDPQQRLLLQSVYEAVEDAGLRLEDLQKCRTGVYVGLMNLDYGRLLLDDGNVQNIDEFASTGITASTAANRISFSLNLNGPSLTVDTACSSSLSALNIAVMHLKARECDVAIVCAPNLILARYFHTACCRTGLLAEDGRCKSFDAKGDGYGRGEGIAVVVLKPTHTALLDNDKPYAQILACGLNNDGQTAIPMTAPSDKMQAELARRVLKESGLRKTDIQYVETHGTGTAVGDVVEMRSVSEVYANTSSRVLRIGSVKSNINHTESTAGLAGLIKVCLMIKNGYFVPTVNIQEQKPQLKIAERNMIVQTKLEPWSAIDDKPKTAAVCSYGYGGANAHVIVQEVQSTQSTESCPRKREAWILTLSARSREALRIMAERFSEWLEQEPDDDCILKEDICYTLNNRRSVLSHRLALSFCSFKQAANLLKLFSNDSPGWQKFIAVNDNPTSVKKLAFIYGGQGNCWYAMASELMKNEKKFQESIQQIDEILAKLQIPWRLMETLGKSELASSQIEGNPIAQMALFGVHYGMTQLLKSWGITPSAVVGHSLGEISAACAAHVISLEEAVQLIVLRAGLQESCSPTGRMMAVGMSPETVKEVIRSLCLVTSVSVAAVNSPVNVVLSGDQQAMHVVEDYLQRNHGEVFCKRLGTTRAFHSQDMDSIKEEFMEEIDRLELCPGMK
jgi:3-oxoacyl-(acyl-carrier-protein) synthase